MILPSILLILGFLLVIKGADFFVTAASSLGVKLKIPQIVIGLTVVAFGTSLPELVINIMGSVAKNNDIVLGNIVGSNIFNTLFILGMAALIHPITAKKNTFWKEIPFVILVSLILFILSNDKMLGGDNDMITRGDGIILLIFFGYFLFYVYKVAIGGGNDLEKYEEIKNWKMIFFFIFGIAGLILGGKLVVSSAIDIAKYFQVSDKIIAITIISIGTGLPELMTSVVAAYKRNSSIALGNIVGSNIFNILLVIGTSSVIYPVSYSSSHFFFDYMILIISAAILFISMFLFKKATITRIEGFCMAMLYISYIIYSLCRLE